MGLVFPLQLDLRKSTPEELVLTSTSKRFSVGSTFLFVGLVLATMHLAAAPLFKIMWDQGSFFDRALATFFYGMIFAFPVICIICWFYKSKVSLRKTQEGSLQVSIESRLGPISWGKSENQIAGVNELEITNWKGAVNMASLQSQQKSTPDRYATRGHWILRLKGHPKAVIERRAKRDDIDWLHAQIEAFFSLKT